MNGESNLTQDARRDVQTLFNLLRDVVGEDDIQMFVALINEEASFRKGKMNLPIVKQLAHELIKIAEKGLAALGEEAPSGTRGERISSAEIKRGDCDLLSVTVRGDAGDVWHGWLPEDGVFAKMLDAYICNHKGGQLK